MKVKRILLRALTIAFGVMGFMVLQWVGLSRLQNEHETATARRLVRLAGGLLHQAHQTQDDLLLQQTVQSVALAPGVSWAAVVDPQNKIIAHSDPSLLGQVLRTRERAGLWSHMLGEGRGEWGKFIFRFSDTSFQTSVRREIVLQLFLLMLAAIAAFLRGLFLERERVLTLSRTADLTALLEAERSRNLRLEAKALQAISRSQGWLTSAINRVDYPAFLLDAQQRVLALNRSAQQHFKIAVPASVQGRSWNDVGCLCAIGAALEQSLLSPGTDIHPADSPFTLLTSADGAGTWVTLPGASIIVK